MTGFTDTWIAEFQATYNGLSAESVDQLDAIYAPEVVFIDPAHQVHGLANLKTYFRSLYQQTEQCQFAFGHSTPSGNATHQQWTMSLKHPKLNAGKPIDVDGVSYLEMNADGLITLHRDYFDLGAMLYERVPVVGYVIRAMKKRLGQ